MGRCRASTLVGANPRGALRRVSLAVRSFLTPRIDEGGVAVLVGVSGGADSLALAVAVIDQCTRSGIEVHTLTVDHSLREGSAEEATRVATRLEGLGARASSTTVQVLGPGGPESSARDVRRQVLREQARAVLAQERARRVLLLLGHTMDDQAETVLLRLARGSGAGSLRAMSPEVPDEGGLVWCRPLLEVRRRDTREACRQLGLEWVEDPSNVPDGPWRAADGSALRRSAVRAEALPALAAALGEDPVPALARSAHLLARDDDALGAAADQLLLRAWVPDGAGIPEQGDPRPRGGHGQREPGPSQGSGPPPGPDRPASPVLDVEVLAAAAPALRGRALHTALVRAGARPGDLSATHVEAVSALVTHWHGQGPLDLPGLRVVRGRRGTGPVLELTPAPLA
ncbi:MAG: tRNA lysidine(34) synthetase TilS [Pauljensenia sp.]